ncbi:MAG: exodeoxyribonuclease VII large subunit [Candidatus Kaelpia aquatica]|nr:exodeoxyribonuclease VII large subunit [Candidatus Kaelpia aquatica]
MENKRKVYTVSDISKSIKHILEDSLGYVWVEGEVSNLSLPGSGHVYFDLKDKSASIPVALFKGFSQKVKFDLENGLHVIAYGKITSYAPQGKYQLRAEYLEPKGLGALMLALIQLKEKLAREGLFEEEHKRRLPFLPGKIGIVTSFSGAAIRDMIKVLRRRFDNIHIMIYSARVQGEYAPAEIISGIKFFNEMEERVDLLIIGRGGGSIEDLWAFNNEELAREIFKSKIPVISAVGHERDWTISDWVADLRAPTPSAAAELAVRVKDELQDRLDKDLRDLKRLLKENLNRKRDILKHIQGRYGLFRIKDIVPLKMQRLDELSLRMKRSSESILNTNKDKLGYIIKHLENLNPLTILSRGYSVTEDLKTGEVIKDLKNIKEGVLLKTRLYKGSIISRVEKKSPS